MLVLGGFSRFLTVRSLFAMLSLAVVIVMIAAMVLVHAFMQHLGGIPGMFVTGSGHSNESGSSQEKEGGFHEQMSKPRIEADAPCANRFCPRFCLGGIQIFLVGELFIPSRMIK